MPVRNVVLTEDLDLFVAMSVESGRYGNVSEVVSAALRSLEREQEDDLAKLAQLRTSIDEGDASGEAEDGVFKRVRQSLALDHAQ